MRTGPFSNPYCLGFDEVERLLDRIAKGVGDGYPPLNIEEPSEDRLRIILAVAGFSPDQLTITLSDRELAVKGERPADQQPGRVYLHKGIAARGFQRSFILAEGIEVEGANLADGLLKIDLRRVRQSPRIVQIPITSG
jgi:HSP20 family molecular chaperone IbpA